MADSLAEPVAELYTRESLTVLGWMKPTGAELISFVAFTLHYHSAAICDRVIPLMEVGRAVALIEALVIAEKIVWLLTDPKQDVLGMIESPTELQRRAWDLTARLWQEWPRELDFCVSIEPKPAAVETYLQKMAEGVAAAASSLKRTVERVRVCDSIDDLNLTSAQRRELERRRKRLAAFDAEVAA